MSDSDSTLSSSADSAASVNTARLEDSTVAIYLITGGLLVLASDYLGVSVTRTWPTLLIVFGAMRIWIHWRQSQAADDA